MCLICQPQLGFLKFFSQCVEETCFVGVNYQSKLIKLNVKRKQKRAYDACTHLWLYIAMNFFENQELSQRCLTIDGNVALPKLFLQTCLSTYVIKRNRKLQSTTSQPWARDLHVFKVILHKGSASTVSSTTILQLRDSIQILTQKNPLCGSERP